MKEKYSLDPVLQIYFEDEHGAEVDKDIFPIFLEQQVIPDLVVKIVGEDQPVIYRKFKLNLCTKKIPNIKNLCFLWMI